MRANEEQINQFLAEHDAWKIDNEQLYRHCRFASFAQAFSFMSAVASLAEEQDHHPDWRNSYRVVEIWLTTHQFKGISQRDFDLATAIDTLMDSQTP
jgi:4a-hydroxytetrahydrobiopterin dehydratase